VIIRFPTLDFRQFQFHVLSKPFVIMLLKIRIFLKQLNSFLLQLWKRLGSMLFFEQPFGQFLFLPPSLQKLGWNVFSICVSLSRVSLENFTACEIASFAFLWCRITSIYIPDSVTTIGQSAFARCGFLKEITFGGDPKLVELDGFSRTVIEELSIPDSVEVIGACAFSDCALLRKCEFGPHSKLRVIGTYSFNGSGLRIVHLPGSLERIDSSVFSDCRFLREISFGDSFTGKCFKDRIFCRESGPISTFISFPHKFLSKIRRLVHCREQGALSDDDSD
jgi:hypothetical protein